MYADIVVESYLSKETGVFTYCVPGNLLATLKEGSCVKVPFGKKILIGYVVELIETSNLRDTKRILEPLFEFPLLTSFQIKLAKWMSWYYCASLIDCLHLMIPPIIRTQYNAKIALTQNSKQIIVTVPTIQMVQKLSTKLPKDKTALFHKGLSKGELFKSWKAVLEGKVQYILGTRSALFAPLRNYSKIVIIDEENSSYKEERSPYYHSRLIAAKLADLTGAELELRSKTPDIETFYWSNQKGNEVTPLSYVPFNLKVEFSKKVETQIVDLNQYPIKKGFSSVLNKEIVETLKKKGRVFLFLNKVNDSGFVSCPSCGLKSYLKIKPKECPQCYSSNVEFFTFNIRTLKTETSTRFPSHSAYFIIGSQSSLYSLGTQKFDLVGVVSSDTLLDLGNYKSNEKTFQLLRLLTNLVKPNGKLIVQTYNPNHSAIKNSVNNDYINFFKDEIEERKSMHYPPFSQLIRLRLSNKDKEKAEKEISQIVEALKERQPDLEILGPIVKEGKKSGTFVYQLILRGNNLQELLSKLTKKWRVDVDPESI
ncbi:hypothetical protein M1146_07860 [Patescibacteria group bacterium]|nr:hypothetical protein [Patescibacteria group bacterium]